MYGGFNVKFKMVENALQNQMTYEASGQIRQAFDVASDYFAKPYARVWDAPHERLFKNTLRLASQLMVAPESALHTAVRLAVTNPNDTLADNLLEFLSMCDERMEIEQQRADKELQNTPDSELFQKIDLKKLIQESVVNASIEFTHKCYLAILERIFKIQRFETLYHTILRKAFEFTRKYNRPEFHREFCVSLMYYRTATENPRQETIMKIINTQLVCYETSVFFKKYQRAIEALADAFDFSLKYNSLPLEIEKKIEEKKLEILQLTNNKRLAAIQRANMIDFYNSHPSVQPPMPIKEMLELVIIETAASPLFDESSVKDDTVNFPLFLKQTSGTIPSRSDVLTRLILKADITPLTIFIKAAETESDPFLISETYQHFVNQYSEKYEKTLIDELSQYAAINIIERIRIHYDTISFYELGQFIPWMDHVPLEQLLVHAARFNIIPAHINMLTGYISLTPRGSQELVPTMSNMNNQLKNIFDHFQSINKEMAVSGISTTNDDDIMRQRRKAHRAIYDEPYREFNDRPSHLALLIKNVEKKNAARRAKAEAEAAEKRRLEEDEEKKRRREEEEKSKERKKRADSYEYRYAECQLICESLNLDLKEFLEKPLEKGPRKTGKKHEDLEWIELKADELKRMYVQEMQSKSDGIQRTMATVKAEIGKNRVKARLAMKKKLEKEGMLAKEAQIVPKLMAAMEKGRKKQYEEDLKQYEAVQQKLRDITPHFKALADKLKEQFEAARPVKHQPAAGGYVTLAQRKAEEEAKQAEAEKPAEDVEAKKKAEEEEKKRIEEEKEKKVEEEAAAKKKAEEEAAKKKKAEEEKKKAEEAAKKKAEEEAKKKQQEEAEDDEEEEYYEEEEIIEKVKVPVAKSGWGAVNVSANKPIEVGLNSHMASSHQPQPSGRYIPLNQRPRQGPPSQSPAERYGSFQRQQPNLAEKYGSSQGTHPQPGQRSNGPQKQQPSPAEKFGSSQRKPQPNPAQRYGGSQRPRGGRN